MRTQQLIIIKGKILHNDIKFFPPKYNKARASIKISQISPFELKDSNSADDFILTVCTHH